MEGTVVAINVAERTGGAIRTLTEADLVAGRGIVGDRYYRDQATAGEEELTLVAIEEVERFNVATGLALDPADTRRNIVTRGLSLNELVGVELALGGARVEGLELCEPCRYLADRLAAERRTVGVPPKDVVAALTHRAGLRARIVQSGTVKVGDPIRARAPD